MRRSVTTRAATCCNGIIGVPGVEGENSNARGPQEPPRKRSRSAKTRSGPSITVSEEWQRSTVTTAVFNTLSRQQNARPGEGALTPASVSTRDAQASSNSMQVRKSISNSKAERWLGKSQAYSKRTYGSSTSTHHGTGLVAKPLDCFGTGAGSACPRASALNAAQCG